MMNRISQPFYRIHHQRLFLTQLNSISASLSYRAMETVYFNQNMFHSVHSKLSYWLECSKWSIICFFTTKRKTRIILHLIYWYLLLGWSKPQNAVKFQKGQSEFFSFGSLFEENQYFWHLTHQSISNYIRIRSNPIPIKGRHFHSLHKASQIEEIGVFEILRGRVSVQTNQRR